jgi:hypothetical protein
VKLNVVSNVPLKVGLAGCSGSPARSFRATPGGACLSTGSLLVQLHVARRTRVLRATVYVNGRRVETVTARRRRSVTRVRIVLRGVHSGTVHVVLRLRAISHRHAVRLTERRTFHTCR